MRSVLLFLIFIPVLASCGQSRGPLEGVWRVKEDRLIGGPNEGTIAKPQPSIYIFGKRYFSIMRVNYGEPRPLWPEGIPRTELTDAQVRSTLLPFVANAGEYEIDGATIITRPIVALSPNFMQGVEELLTYERNGEDLILIDTSVSPADEQRWTLERLE